MNSRAAPRPAGRAARRSVRGFTLVEVTVALAIAGLVVLLAHGVLLSVIDAAGRADAYARASDREANRRLWLTRAFAAVVVGADPRRGFQGVDGVTEAGEADHIAFASTVRSETGRVVREIALSLDGAGTLVARVSPLPGEDGERVTLALATGLRGFGAEYLPAYGESSAWVPQWSSPVSAPVAARLRLARAGGMVDTLVLHIGGRG